MKLFKTRLVDMTLPQAIPATIIFGLVTVAFIWSPWLLGEMRQKIFGAKEVEEK